MASQAGGWRPEHAWLCRLARTNIAPRALEELARDAASLDFDVLFATADLHGVTELLHPAFAAVRATLPASALERLETRVVQVTALNLSRAAQLIQLIERLRSSGIDALAFKGPTLSQIIYGQLGRRASTDLDILVHRRDAARVRPLLVADGYSLPPRRRHRGGSLLYGLFPAAGRDDTLLPPVPALAAVDVHVGFSYWTQGIRMDVDALFTRAVGVDVLGRTVRTLSPDDLLLVLSIHGLMHGWSALRLLTDIDGVATRVQDWERVVSRAQAAKALRVLWVALLLSSDVLGTAVPESVLARAQGDAAAVAIGGSVKARLFDPDSVMDGKWDPRPWLLSFQDDRWGRARFHARDLVYEWFLKWPWDEWLGRRPSGSQG
jgi:hypothetical protein